MREVRVYSQQPLAPAASFELDGGCARHISQVLRMQPGQAVVLFDGSGGEYPAEITAATRNRVSVRTGAHVATERESPLQITLWHGLCRAERMDTVVQKATELGVQQIQPLLTERSMIRLDEKRARKKTTHWQNIAISACEQSGRNRIPTLLPPARFADLLTVPAAVDARLLLHPTGTQSLAAIVHNRRSLLICSGPEGGFSAAEVAAAESAGFNIVSMGPRILRTETAPLTALSIAQTLAGDLN